KSAPYLDEFYSRCVVAAEQITENFEIVLVNDGSPDDSLDVALRLRDKDRRVKIVDFSRNFGHHKAMMTGLMHTKGEWVFLIDADLEEPPELLLEFDHLIRKNTDLDVVYGVQERRKGGWFERWTGQLFFMLINTLSKYPLPNNVITARLMSRRYVDALVLHKDKEVFMLGLWAITGFKQMGITVRKASKGKTSYTLARKFSMALNAVTSFSNRPLYCIFIAGAVVAACSFCLACFYILQWLFLAQGNQTGFTTLVVSIWMVGGMNMICLGVIGMYLAKVFSEVKDRPYTIVRKFHFGTEGGNGHS
ncbi:MAG: glycosyltransferase family 2 protein, partial [Bacteroidales bacterium]|nr:glycosyltransferase family 2 protein [Bacteroidales bacterium]